MARPKSQTQEEMLAFQCKARAGEKKRGVCFRLEKDPRYKGSKVKTRYYIRMYSRLTGAFLGYWWYSPYNECKITRDRRRVRSTHYGSAVVLGSFCAEDLTNRRKPV